MKTDNEIIAEFHGWKHIRTPKNKGYGYWNFPEWNKAQIQQTIRDMSKPIKKRLIATADDGFTNVTVHLVCETTELTKDEATEHHERTRNELYNFLRLRGFNDSEITIK